MFVFVIVPVPLSAAGMDNLKCIGGPEQAADVKRLRPEDRTSLVESSQHDNDVQSRILLNKTEFSKVIGRGGKMITNIRVACGSGV